MIQPEPGAVLPAALETARQTMADGGWDDLGQLLPVVYEQLRALAGRYLDNQPPGHTLQPTALVHEAYAKLAASGATWSDREHFLALAATVMRQVLADHARGLSRQKRGGDWQRITVGGIASTDSEGRSQEIDLVALDGALRRLESLDSRQARIVELRFLAGMTVQEVAKVLGVSRRTVELDWRGARAWLRRELDGTGSP